MRILRLFTLGALGVALAMGGCSLSQNGDSSRDRVSQGNPLAPEDTVPAPSPSPTPPPPIPPAQFAGWDSTWAGQTGITRWRLGNDSDAPFTMSWMVDMADDWMGPPWPGFPIQGTTDLAPLSQRTIEVAIAVPAGTWSGMYPLRMDVTRPGGLTYTELGAIRVVSDVAPPPPPPPPTPAVAFAGADSGFVGQSAGTRWQLHNESDAPFAMQWTLVSRRNWPGFPIHGIANLDPQGQALIEVQISVPDSAAAGYNPLDMTVTRPGGLGPVTGEGGVQVWP